MEKWLSWRPIVSAIVAFFIGCSSTVWAVSSWKTEIENRVVTLEKVSIELTRTAGQDHDTLIRLSERSMTILDRLNILTGNLKEPSGTDNKPG